MSSINGLEEPDYTLPDGGYLIDADTYAMPDGKHVRIQGINAYETQKIGDSVAGVKAAQVGADTQRLLTHKIIQDKGFNVPVLTGAKDKYGREIGDLANAEGYRLSDYMLRNGLVDTLMPTQAQVETRDWGNLERAVAKANSDMPTQGQVMYDLLLGETGDIPLVAKGFTTTAKQYGASLDENGKSQYFTGPGAIMEGEDYKGYARSNLSTGFESGLTQMKQGAWSTLKMIGDIADSKSLQDLADRNINAYQSHLEDLPYLRSGEAFGSDGKWKLDSFMEATDYLVGTAAASAPQMIASIGAVMAAPLTMGASLSLPAVIYTGTTYNNQKEKNPSLALASGIAQAALESLGVGGVIGNIFRREGREAVVAQLVKKGYTKEAAEQAIIESTKKAVKDVTMAQELLAAQHARKVGVATLEGMASEAPTEMAQEYAQFVGETGTFSPDTPEGMIQLHNRMLNAGVGGLALGGAFGGGGRLASNIVTKAPDGPKVGTVEELRTLLLASPLKSVPNAEEVGADASTQYEQASLDKLAMGEINRKAAMGFGDKASDWAKNSGVGSLFQKWSTSIMKGVDAAGVYTGALSTLLGSSRALNGGSVEESQRDITATIGSKFAPLHDLLSRFGMKKEAELVSFLGTDASKSLLSSISTRMETTGDTNIDDLLSEPNKKHGPALVHLVSKIKDTIKEYNRVTKSSMSMEEFLNNHSLNKDRVSRDRGTFVQMLQSEVGLTPEQANEAYLSILDNPHVNSMDDLFDPFVNMSNPLTNLKADPRKRLNMPDTKAKFIKYMNTDVLSNANSLAAKGGAVYVHKFLIGQDGKNLAAILQAAVSEKEITEEKASMIALQLKDWLDMRAGKYHRIENPYVKGALGLVNFLSTVSSLPLAAISSTVEFAQVYRHLNTAQSLKATKSLLKGAGHELGKIMEFMGKEGHPTDYENALYKAGMLHEGGVGRRNDVMVNYFNKWTEGFFKMTGLTSVTNITRYAKLSIASDAMNNWLSVVRRELGEPEQSEKAKSARENLQRIGVDVDFCVNVNGQMTPEMQQRFSDEMTRGAHSFVAEAVIHPTKMNRPKFYSDPYLQLFTQFQGYVSAFTANVLPLLLKDLNKRGSAEQVNAAAAIAMMFALAYLAGYVKDMIKYGESPPEWLKKDKEFQRYIGQVGILGTGQRIWDSLSPILEDNQRRSVMGQAIASITDQSPALTYIKKLDDAISAPDNSQIKKSARLLPFFGTSPQFAAELQKVLGD